MVLSLLTGLTTGLLNSLIFALSHVFEWFKFVIRFITDNFKFDNERHVWSLSFLLLILVVIFHGLFGGFDLDTKGRYSAGADLGFLEGDTTTEEEREGGAETTTIVCQKDIDCDGINDDIDEDIDGDGKDNKNDEDIDGDGIPNELDQDDDGDDIPDELDTMPCGNGVPEIDCIRNESDCGDGVCLTYTIIIGRHVIRLGDENAGTFYFNIPARCLQYGTILTTYTVLGKEELGIYGSKKLQESLSVFCEMGDTLNMLRYFENAENCEEDCKSHNATCNVNTDCGSGQINAGEMAYCCPFSPTSNCTGYCVSDNCIRCELEEYPCNTEYAIDGFCVQCIEGTIDYGLCNSICENGGCIRSTVEVFPIHPYNNTVIETDEEIFFDWI